MLFAKHVTTEGLEILDEGGKSVGSVTLPTDSRLFGANRETVYLNRMPAAVKSPGNPAQAA